MEAASIQGTPAAAAPAPPPASGGGEQPAALKQPPAAAEDVIRLDKPRDTCMYCGKEDYVEAGEGEGGGLDPRTLVYCSCCTHMCTHVECHQQSVNDMDDEFASKAGMWFCSKVSRRGWPHAAGVGSQRSTESTTNPDQPLAPSCAALRCSPPDAGLPPSESSLDLHNQEKCNSALRW